MKLVRIWRFGIWCRLTHADAWGFQVGVEYRRRPITEGIGFKEWVVGFHFNSCDNNCD